MKVRISGNAFGVMLASSIEVYKKEAFGFLIGRRHNGGLVINNAVPSQSAERGFTEVSLNDRTNQLRDILSRLGTNGSRVIGYYHTHPDWGKNQYKTVASESDLLRMRKEGGLVYLIIAISDKKRGWPWHYRSDGGLAGSFDAYWFEIAAYYRNGREQFNKGRIVCPSATLRK